MSDVNRVTKNTVIFIAAFGIMALLNYAFAVGLSWILDASEFGVLGVAQSLLLLGALIVGSGFAWTTSKEFAAKGQTERSRRRFRTAVLANTILGLCLALALWATYTLGWLDLGRAYQTIVPLIALTILVLAARSVVNGAAQGMYRFGAVSVNQVGEVAVKITAGLALVFLGFGVSGVMVAFALGALAALIHSVFLVRPAKLWRGRGWFDRSVLAMTAPLFLGILGPALILNLDILGLKLLSPSGQSDELAGYYQASVILTRTPVLVARTVITVVFAYVAGTAVRDSAAQKKEIDSYATVAVRAWSRFLLPICLILALAPGTVLTVFFPQSYQVTIQPLRIAALGSIALTLATLLIGIAQAADRKYIPALAAGLAILVQMAILLWLIPIWGATGAAVSLVVAGSILLIGAAIAFRPLHWPSIESLVREIGPLMALTGMLILLPAGGQIVSIFKLVAAGLVYILVLSVLAIPRLRLDKLQAPFDWTSGQMANRLIMALLGG